jgi:conserved hypothetical protein
MDRQISIPFQDQVTPLTAEKFPQIRVISSNNTFFSRFSPIVPILARFSGVWGTFAVSSTLWPNQRYKNGRMLTGLKKYLRFTILFLAAAAILWFFGKDLDWQQVRQSLARADITYVLLAVGVICLGYLLRAVRWQVLLAPITKTSLKELFATTTVGFAAIFLVGRAGEIVRPMWLPMRDPRVRPSAALVTLGLERIFDLAALVCFFSINLLWFTPPVGREHEFVLIQNAGYLMIVGVVVGFVMLAIFQRISDRAIAWIERVTDKSFIPARLRKIIISIFKQLASALGIMRDWKQLLLVSFWSIALWFSISLPTWFVLLAFDLPITFSDSLFIRVLR